MNDEVPQFLRSKYVGQIVENSPIGTPVQFVNVGNGLNLITDPDVGANGTFNIFLDGAEGIFEVSPTLGINTATFVVSVKDASKIDFEARSSFNFSVVAKELGSIQGRESRAEMTVVIEDANDNSPNFEKGKNESF